MRRRHRGLRLRPPAGRRPPRSLLRQPRGAGRRSHWPIEIALWIADHTVPGKVFEPPASLFRSVSPTHNRAEIFIMGYDENMVWGARTDALYGVGTTMDHAWHDVGKLRVPTFISMAAPATRSSRGNATDTAVSRLPSGVDRTACYGGRPPSAAARRTGPQCLARRRGVPARPRRPAAVRRAAAAMPASTTMTGAHTAPRKSGLSRRWDG